MANDLPPAATRADGTSAVGLVDEMRSSYLDYAMSVIVARALPDVRDGLKPVHRRILYAAQRGGYIHDKPFRKSARIVGDVMGTYHPHGDQAIYDALARMAQPWSMRLPLIDGQGNFGSMDPDPPAAMRYTEARLTLAAGELLADIDRDTVDFVPNYDGQDREPSVLPARIPNLLVNGSGGIAVGMATNIPPHNLGEVVDACLSFLDDRSQTSAELMAHVPAPDFPTGGLILRTAGLAQAMTTGRGSIMVRSAHEVETRGAQSRIVLTEIPYQQGKSALVERIAEAVKDRRIEGVTDLRDESNREGVRIVLELRRDAQPEVVLNQLWRHTPAQQSFAANMLALVGGRPLQLELRDMVAAFVDFRADVVGRRSRYELARARERAHLLLGLALAVGHLDEVVALIRAAASPAEARAALMQRDWPADEIGPYLALIGEEPPGGGRYRLSDAQVKAILELRLHRLTALGRDEIARELDELAARIRALIAVLESRSSIDAEVRRELAAVRAAFVTPRRSLLVESDDVEDEDLIPREDMVVTVTLSGWIKRVGLDAYRAQRRGGRGRNAMGRKEEDTVTDLFVASTHAPVLFFSNQGRVYRLKVWRLPEGSPQARGRAMANLLPLAPGETVTTVLPLPEDPAQLTDLHVLFATARGLVRRNSMEAFANVPSGGKIAMRFEEDSDDRLVGVALCDPRDDALLATRLGRAIRFPVAQVREFQSRTSTGVRGIELAAGDRLISLSILSGFQATADEREAYLRAAPWKGGGETPELPPRRMAEFERAEQFILTVTANGYGKRTSAHEYRRTGRGGQGVTSIDTSARNGPVVASFPLGGGEQLMLVTDQAKLIRMKVADIRIMGRATQGVTLVRTAEGEQVVGAARILDTDEPGDLPDDDTPGDDTPGDDMGDAAGA